MRQLNGLVFGLAISVSLATVPVVFAETEEEIPLSDVPRIVVEAAVQEMQGIQLSEAEKVTTDTGVQYELEGAVGGERV